MNVPDASPELWPLRSPAGRAAPARGAPPSYPRGMTIGHAIRCHRSREEIAAEEPDPHRRSRLLYGECRGGASEAAKDSHPLIYSAWCHMNDEAKRAIIELRWRREPTAEERTETARAAAAALVTWLGQEGWHIRCRVGRPSLPGGALKPLRP